MLTKVELDSEGGETEGMEKSKMARVILESSGETNLTNIPLYSAGVYVEFERRLSDKDLSKSFHI